MSRERSTDGGDQKCVQFWRGNSNRLLGYPMSKYVRAFRRSRCIATLMFTFDTTWEGSDSRPGCYTPPIPTEQEALRAPQWSELGNDIKTDHNRLEGVEWIKLARMGTCYTRLQTRQWNVWMHRQHCNVMNTGANIDSYEGLCLFALFICLSACQSTNESWFPRMLGTTSTSYCRQNLP